MKDSKNKNSAMETTVIARVLEIQKQRDKHPLARRAKRLSPGSYLKNTARAINKYIADNEDSSNPVIREECENLLALVGYGVFHTTDVAYFFGESLGFDRAVLKAVCDK